MGVIFLGAALLIGSLFVGWYENKGTITETVGGVTITVTASQTFLLGNMVQNSQSYSCSSGVPCPPSTSNTSSYSDIGLKNTGNLAMILQSIVIAGAVLGLFGGLLAFGARQQRQNWVRPAVIFALVAMIIALLAPSIMLALQPGAIHSDNIMGFNNNGSTPATSFFGSCSNTCFGAPSGSSFNWGPTTGWYMSYAAFAVLLAGAFILFFLARKPPEVT